MLCILIVVIRIYGTNVRKDCHGKGCNQQGFADTSQMDFIIWAVIICYNMSCIRIQDIILKLILIYD